MFVARYGVKFDYLCRHATHLVTIEKEKIQLFIKVLDSELQILSVYMLLREGSSMK